MTGVAVELQMPILGYLK